jgi:O-methyltransferase involved in polyketide biosynthesis
VPAGRRGHVRFVPADLTDADLALVLRRAGLRRERTAVVWDRRALDGTGDFGGVAEWAATVRAAGEPFTFGFVPDELPGHLSERGMRLTVDRSARHAADEYLEPLGRHEPAAPFYRIAQAEVE